MMNMNVRRTPTTAETEILALFTEKAGSLSGDAQLTLARDKAIDLIKTAGLPTRRDERWHYTDLRTLLRGLPAASDVPAGPEALLPNTARLVVENGVAHQSDIAVSGVAISTSHMEFDRSAAIASDDAVGTINTSLFSDGYAIQIDDGAELSGPLEIISKSSDGNHVRNSVKVGAKAIATIVERQIGGGFYSSMNHLMVGDGAKVQWVIVQERDDAAIDLSRINVTLGKDAVLTIVIFNAGGKLIRQEIDVDVKGEGADFNLRAVNLIDGDRHIDITMQVLHDVPNTTSTQLVRNVVMGRGQGVFQGQIRVAPIAQKTDARMACNTLLLSDDAGFYAKPELEIFADDVACGHGATVAEINADHLFYLMARGIPENQARSLLIKAFVASLIEEIDDEALVDALEVRLDDWFALHAADR